MEIERKFLIPRLPENWKSYPCRIIEQAYLCREPVLRVRRSDDQYILTIKGQGILAHEEHEFPLTREAYEHLRSKADGSRIAKRRVLIPFGSYTIEMDIFQEPFDDMILAEVEFPSVEEANAFLPPDWFGPDVTADLRYRNSTMSISEYPGKHFLAGKIRADLASDTV